MNLHLLAESPPLSSRRVALFSLHNLIPAAWNGVIYEFMNVVARMECARMMAPEPVDAPQPGEGSLWWDYRVAAQKTTQRILSRLPMLPRSIDFARRRDEEFDLLFYACQFAHEIPEINRIPAWRQRSRTAAIFILEAWPNQIERRKAHLRKLDAFDHVFVFNAASVPLIQRHTSTPVSFLPTAVDTLLLPAERYNQERTVDYLCIGRCPNPVHQTMYEYCCRKDRFYVFDLWRDLHAKDWAAVRRQNADIGTRARHYVVWPPIRERDGNQSDTALTTRYFEGASSGAVMIGGAAGVAEFEGLFSSPTPVVDMPEDPEKVPAFLDWLDAEADCLVEIGRMNRLDVLARHDWAHRWAEILRVLGLGTSAGLEQRLDELRRRHVAEGGCERHFPAALSTRPALTVVDAVATI